MDLRLRYTQLFFFWISVLIRTIRGIFRQNLSNFTSWLPVQMTFDLYKAIISYNSKTKHRRSINLHNFWILMTRRTIWYYFQRKWNIFQFLTHMELSRSLTAILEMPQYVAYLKNFVQAFIKLSAKSHNFNILCTMNVLSCPTITFSGDSPTINMRIYSVT